MSTTGDKVLRELKSIFWVSLYFLSWFGMLFLIKSLLLEEYHIDSGSYTVAIIGALVVAKVVLILENVRIPFIGSMPAIVEVMIRTFMYVIGVAVVMILEKSFEARHDYGGMAEAMADLAAHLNLYHFLVSIICISGALLFYNLWSVFRISLGAPKVKSILLYPLRKKKPFDN